jgi:hypothetical protein
LASRSRGPRHRVSLKAARSDSFKSAGRALT